MYPSCKWLFGHISKDSLVSKFSYDIFRHRKSTSVRSLRTTTPPLSLCFDGGQLWGFSDGSVIENHPVNAGDVGSIPGPGRFPGEGNGTYFSILAWEIPRTEEPWCCKRVGHNLATKQQQQTLWNTQGWCVCERKGKLRYLWCLIRGCGYFLFLSSAKFRGGCGSMVLPVVNS